LVSGVAYSQDALKTALKGAAKTLPMSVPTPFAVVPTTEELEGRRRRIA
jgi:hypothetical protein